QGSRAVPPQVCLLSLPVFSARPRVGHAGDHDRLQATGRRLDFPPFHGRQRNLLATMDQIMMRSHYCGEVHARSIDETVTVCGWVHRRRDHGGVIFVDLRDHTGLLQVVFDPDQPAMFAEAERLRSEYVIRVQGRVRPRPEGTVNTELASGEVELASTELEVLNAADTPPLQLAETETVGDAARLRYRYIALRKGSVPRQ